MAHYESTVRKHDTIGPEIGLGTHRPLLRCSLTVAEAISDLPAAPQRAIVRSDGHKDFSIAEFIMHLLRSGSDHIPTVSLPLHGKARALTEIVQFHREGERK